jgi:hypothetical protein
MRSGFRGREHRANQKASERLGGEMECVWPTEYAPNFRYSAAAGGQK